MAKVENEIEDLIKEQVENLGYELYDVLYLKEGKDKILRIVIDNDKGITLEDCEKVNDEIKDVVDEADLIKDQYFFEVSSPGIERILRKDWQLKKYIGHKIYVKLFKKDKNGKKEYIANLLDFDNECIKIETEKQIDIERKDISQIKTVYEEF